MHIPHLNAADKALKHLEKALRYRPVPSMERKVRAAFVAANGRAHQGEHNTQVLFAGKSYLIIVEAQVTGFSFSFYHTLIK